MPIAEALGLEAKRMAQGTVTDFFIGREREISELTASLERALEGNGGLVMLAGEPGIGKTRLTEEIVTLANDREVRAAWGACYEGGATPPYWPWTLAIRSLLSDPGDAVLTALQPRAAIIAEIVPEITDIVSDLPSLPDLAPEQARFRLFDSITSFLTEISASQPLVLVLDDLHWADRTSLDLLEFIARDVATKSILLIGTYRDMELSRRHPLSNSLAAFTRARGFARLTLRGLESDDVAKLVSAVGDLALPNHLIEEIHHRTEGNPFFVGEVTRDLAREIADRGGDFDAVKFRVPEGVREAVGIRLNKLSEECNTVLRTASVIGREFDFALLAALNPNTDDEDLLDLIEEAIAAATVREVHGRAERYEFTHALIEQTLTEELTTGRRVRLHARIVEAMEELYADSLNEHVAQLAHHCAEAETVVSEAKIVKYARLAGELAVSSYAWAEARAYFEQALDVLDDDAPNHERAAIMFELGRSELYSLSYPGIQRGWDNVAKAFDIYDELGDQESAVAVAMRSRGYLPVWVHSTSNIFARALKMVPSESRNAGYLLEQYAMAIRLEETDVDGSISALNQALEIARRSNDIQLEIRVLVSMSWMKLIESDFRQGIDVGQQAIELLRQTDQPVDKARALGQTAACMICNGDPTFVSQYLEAAHALERQYG
ncbi:MAG: AAA family ATPase, partial [Dehalococcoidia bacterium]